MVEEMRAAYRRCEPFLSTVPSRTDQDAQSKMAKVMLMGLGYTEKELAKLDFDSLDVGAFQELVTKKMGQNADANGTRQRLVEGTELPRYLDEGWTVVTTVNGHQVVLNRRGHDKAVPPRHLGCILGTWDLVGLAQDEDPNRVRRVQPLDHRLQLSERNHQVRSTEPREMRWRPRGLCFGRCLGGNVDASLRHLGRHRGQRADSTLSSEVGQ